MVDIFKPQSKKPSPLGMNSQDKGYIHYDIWEGLGADLAERGYIVVHPVTGWWKERKNKNNKDVRFSLIVSIQTDSEDIDLYTSVAQMVEQSVETPTVIEI